MFRLPKLLLATPALVLFSLPAHAANFVLGASATGGGDYTFGVNDAAVRKSATTDTFTFTIPGTSNGTMQIALINTGTGNNNIDFISAVLTGTSSPVTLAVSNIGSLSTAYTIADVPAIAGATYVLTVDYMAGAKGAIFNGNVSFTPTAAPEPAAWALMILGFGVVGAALRRRNQRPSHNMAVSYS